MLTSCDMSRNSYSTSVIVKTKLLQFVPRKREELGTSQGVTAKPSVLGPSNSTLLQRASNTVGRRADRLGLTERR